MPQTNTGPAMVNILVPVPNPVDYEVVLSSDDKQYGGWERTQHQNYSTKLFDGKYYVELYLPARSAIVLKAGKLNEPVAEPVKEKETEKAPEQKPLKKVKAYHQKEPLFQM